MLPKTKEIDSEDKRLCYHTRADDFFDRSVEQRHLQVMKEILSAVLPGLSQINAIMWAKVPIIKFQHQFLGLEVDLSMNNLSGLYMSELLYLLGELDSRVRPLIFCIRRWASATKLTMHHPGKWITNFGLTSLVIFFLQQLKKPILPTINSLNELGRPVDVRLMPSASTPSVNFLRDIELLNFRTENKSTVGELLMDFFTFCAKSEFKRKTLSLHTGSLVQKNGGAALHIINPLEPDLNVTKNVIGLEVSRLSDEANRSLQLLQNHLTNSTDTDTDIWGIVKLFQSDAVSINKSASTVLESSEDTTIKRLITVEYLYAQNEKPSLNEVEEKEKLVKSRLNLTMDKSVNKVKQTKPTWTPSKAQLFKRNDSNKRSISQNGQNQQQTRINLSTDLSKILKGEK